MHTLFHRQQTFLEEKLNVFNQIGGVLGQETAIKRCSHESLDIYLCLKRRHGSFAHDCR